MKKNVFRYFACLFLSSLALTACGGSNSGGDEPAPKVTINLRSCSVTEGTEYVASQLNEVVLSYNNVVAVSANANITLNDVKCSAKSGSTTAMDVVITLPTLEEGKAYVLNIPEGAIVSKTDNTDLFNWSVLEIVAADLKILDITRDLHADPEACASNIETEYEAKYSGFGEKIQRVVIGRR